MSGGRERTALEETGARLGQLLRRALRDRLARRRDGVSTDGHAQSAPAWASVGQGVGDRDGGEAGQARSDNKRDSIGGTDLAALPLPGGARPARNRGELR
ncbi:hypothetical protein H6M51_16155 [Rhizobium sp. AQ_MP]|uniref:hypothetical protein n=1 Tax=Rhizobium sp. AQ_MP TaxID=2761536 RepID=UPI00163AC602|nr:hypothetical protein [Rhizobium sp. AQ_MP]MBC2774399.1 hypothetical protein [Rhizobium sp. AQ_MP]